MEIPLTQGWVTLVDSEDYPALSVHKWYYRNGYAARAVSREGKQVFLLMQNVIMNVEKGTDHINRDKLDNRKVNLRVVSLKLQNFNRSFPKRDLPRGVYYQNGEKYKRYFSLIQIDGERIRLGAFSTPEEASHAYREAAFKAYGEYPPE